MLEGEQSGKKVDAGPREVLSWGWEEAPSVHAADSGRGRVQRTVRNGAVVSGQEHSRLGHEQSKGPEAGAMPGTFEKEIGRWCFHRMKEEEQREEQITRAGRGDGGGCSSTVRGGGC